MRAAGGRLALHAGKAGLVEPVAWGAAGAVLGQTGGVQGPNFLEKLERLLADSPPEVYQLMGEALYVSYLFVWKGAMGVSKKKERIDRVLGWSLTPVAIPDDLVSGLTPGIAHPGRFLAVNAPLFPGYIIELVDQWKEQDPGEGLLDQNSPEAPGSLRNLCMGWVGVARCKAVAPTA